MKRTGIRSVSKKRLASGMLSKVSSRSRPMTPGGTITRSPMKKKRRSAADMDRIYGPPKKRAWMRRRPCAVCVRLGFVSIGDEREGQSQICHVKTGGVGYKDDGTRTWPGCKTHHDDYDQHRGWLGSSEGRAFIVHSAAGHERYWQSTIQFLASSPVHRTRRSAT